MSTTPVRSAPMSEVDLLCNCQRIIHFYAKITNRAFVLPVTEKQLYCSQITDTSLDQCRFGTSKRMSPKDLRVQTNTV